MAILKRTVDPFESTKGLIAGKEYQLDAPGEGEVFKLSGNIDKDWGADTATGYKLGYVQNGQLKTYDAFDDFKNIASNIQAGTKSLAEQVTSLPLEPGSSKTFNLNGQNVNIAVTGKKVISGGRGLFTYEATLPDGRKVTTQSVKSLDNLDNYNFLADIANQSQYGDKFKDFDYFRGSANYTDVRNKNMQTYLNSLGQQFGGLNTYNSQQLSNYYPQQGSTDYQGLMGAYQNYTPSGTPTYFKEGESLVGEGAGSFQDLAGNPNQVPSNLQGLPDNNANSQFQAYDPKTGELATGVRAEQMAGLDQSADFQGATAGQSQLGNVRPLGSTEFQGLVSGWKQAGLTNKEIEDNFLARDGGNIFLKTDAPSHEQVIANRQNTTGMSVTQNQVEEQPDTTIIADEQPEDKMNLPGVADTGQGATIANEASATIKTLEDYIKENTPPETEADQKYDDLSAKIGDILGEFTDKADMQLAEESKRGIEQLRTDYAELNTQIQTRLAEYEALKTDIEGKPITMSSIIGTQAQVEKKKLAEIGLLQARALGLQGQIETAQDAADRAVDLKYSTLETTLKVYETQLDILKDDLDDEEKVFWEARNQMLTDQQNKLAEEKAVEKNINNIALKAQANGADMALVNKIMDATSEVEATNLAGQLATSDGWQYVATPAERDALKAQGYEITQSGGRTYARQPAMGELDIYEAKKMIDARYKTSAGGTDYNKVLSISDAKALGVPYGTTAGQAMAMGITPSGSESEKTDTQNMALGYAQRMTSANEVINDIGGQFTGTSSYLAGSSYFPNVFKSDERQQFEQAQRDFINSVLRKESGAAIAPSEFESAAKQYFPQPGDGEAVLQQKAANRQQVINNFVQASNTDVQAYNNPTADNIVENTEDNSYEDYLNAIK